MLLMFKFFSLGESLKEASTFTLYANQEILLLVSCYQYQSSLSVWNFREETHRSQLDSLHKIQGRVDKCALSDHDCTLALYSKDCYVSIHHIGVDGSITDLHKIPECQTVSFLEVSNFGFLYIGHMKELIAINLDNYERNKIHTEDRIIAMYEIDMKTTSVVITCHSGHNIRIWRKNLGMIAVVDLLGDGDTSTDAQTCIYSIHYVTNKDELVIGHNGNITVYRVKNRKFVYIKKQAHRDNITCISVYQSENSSYLLTMCCYCIKMWRYGDKDLELIKGDIHIANSSIYQLVAVPDVGLFLTGMYNYEAGLVLWRDTNVYLSKRLKESQNFEGLSIST